MNRKQLPPPPPIPEPEEVGYYSLYSDETVRLETNTGARMFLFALPAAVGFIFHFGMSLDHDVMMAGLMLTAIAEFLNIIYWFFKRPRKK